MPRSPWVKLTRSYTGGRIAKVARLSACHSALLNQGHPACPPLVQSGAIRLQKPGSSASAARHAARCEGSTWAPRHGPCQVSFLQHVRPWSAEAPLEQRNGALGQWVTGSLGHWSPRAGTSVHVQPPHAEYLLLEAYARSGQVLTVPLGNQSHAPDTPHRWNGKTVQPFEPGTQKG